MHRTILRSRICLTPLRGTGKRGPGQPLSARLWGKGPEYSGRQALQLLCRLTMNINTNGDSNVVRRDSAKQYQKLGEGLLACVQPTPKFRASSQSATESWRRIAIPSWNL